MMTVIGVLLLLAGSRVPSATGFLPSSPPPAGSSLSSRNVFVSLIDRTTKRFSPSYAALQQSSSDTTALEGPILDTIPTGFHPLFLSVENATQLRAQETAEMRHDPFRFEWGTWAVEDSVDWLMEQLEKVRVQRGVYEKYTGNRHARRLRVASGDHWDCLLHCLPAGQCWEGRWPTGSWTIVKPLTGLAEIASLSGPDRDGKFRTKTSKELRGGSDGSLGGGRSSRGASAIKYIGGALRRYSGKAGATVLLEIILRPPGVKYERTEIIESLQNINETLTIVELEDEPEEAPTEESSLGSSHNLTRDHLGKAMGMSFEQVGGLDAQLDAIARRVLASRANPEAARRLGVSHVRGILMSGPPGCGKTLLARELAHLLGAREPQIVNGPEILDKYIGEAEKKVRELFAPAEQEWAASKEDSALHIIILDEMDAIARKRGTMTSDTTGVRDSVVNQLLAKMDGVKQANNILVVGLTNRPELLDPALLRPGRLEVQLRVELPDLFGRRDIFRIHTRRMRETGALSPEAIELIEDIGDNGMAARTEHFTGAEIAGCVRSAASFALARSVEDEEDLGVVGVEDLENALEEVVPALGKQDEALKMRFPLGISPCCVSMERVMRDLKRFTTPVRGNSARLQSLLLVGGGRSGGAGSTALAAWAAAEASAAGSADYVRFITSLDILTGEGSGGDGARAAALIERFSEAKEMKHSLLVIDDVDQLCAGSGQNNYSSVMIATLRALLRTPPTSAQSAGKTTSSAKTMQVIAATSRSDAACVMLHELFDETVVIPVLSDVEAVKKLFSETLSDSVVDVESMSKLIIERLGSVGVKTALRLAELAISVTERDRSAEENIGRAQVTALWDILEDFAGDEVTARNLCEVF